MNNFAKEVEDRIAANSKNQALLASASEFLYQSTKPQYSYNFAFMGRPIIQYPQDMVAIQEVIWAVKPDLIIETGIAHGGSLIMSAAMLSLLELCESLESQTGFDPRSPKRKVLGVDIEIRPHNREAIEAHPMSNRIRMIEGPSTAPEAVSEVSNYLQGFNRIMVFLDSNHTHDHVKEELEIYGPMTSVGSYCVVFDTIVEDLPTSMYPERPWGPGNNPKTAVRDFLQNHPEFEIDTAIDNKLLISVAPEGYMRRIF